LPTSTLSSQNSSTVTTLLVTGFFAGTTEFMAFASQIMKVSVLPSESDPNTFVSTCKGLLVWGRKVFAGNRGRGAVLRATIA
jgi:predicted Rdx family selenoprotein